MTPEEFRQTCLRRGYAFSLQIKQWMKRHPKETYTEEDAEALFNFFDGIAWRNIKKSMESEDEDDE